MQKDSFRVLDAKIMAKPQPMQMAERLVEMKSFRYGLTPTTTDNKGEGPGGSPIQLIAQIRSDIEVEDPLGLVIYEDRNPASGLYYYVPTTYRLVWEETGGYGLRIDFLASTEEGQPGSVMVNADLDADVGSSERRLAEQLMEDYAAQRGRKFEKAKFLPVPLGQELKASFVDDLNKFYNIDKVIVHAATDVLSRIRVSWVTNDITTENMKLLLFDMGLQGMVTFLPPGGTTAAPAAVASIYLADPHTFGRIAWVRGEQIRNRTPYTLQLRYLNVLRKEKNTKEPIIYTWDLGGTKVPQQSSVEFKTGSIPTWVDEGAMCKWIEYDITDRTPEQDEAVVDEITGGVFSLARSDITVHPIDALSGTGAYEIGFRVRSRYFESHSKEVLEKKVILAEDKKDVMIPDIYEANWQHREMESDPLFEYWLEVVMPNGQTHSSTQWIPHRELRCLIGTYQIKQALGYVPGAGGGTP